MNTSCICLLLFADVFDFYSTIFIQEEGIPVDIEKAKREASELYQAGEKKFWFVFFLSLVA
jgi:hypothetical protein